jgi:tripartite-type tricarboxylate transporter receptor subunit TctC
MHKQFRLAALAASAISVGAFAAPVLAADYFAGKSITVQVPSGSGGTYHVYCQLVQRNIGKFLPGKPSTVIQNLPGSGGAKSAAFMANVAPKDGKTIAMIAPGNNAIPLVRKVKFDVRKFKWLGAPAARPSAVWLWHTTKINNLKQVQDNPVTIGTSGFGSAGSVFPRLANKVLGTKFKLIYGYKGGGAINVSIERGETFGRWNFYSGFTGVRPTWIPEKKVVPVLAMGPRHPGMKGVPHFTDLLKDGSYERQLYDVFGMDLEVGQAFYAPPGTPMKIVSILRDGFNKMLDDKGFQDEIIKRRVEYSPVRWQKIEELIAAGYKAATPKVIEGMKEIYTKAKKS